MLASAGECGKGETNSPLTIAMVLENGRPLSRANDHSWREVAIALMTPEVRTTMIMVVITLVAV